MPIICRIVRFGWCWRRYRDNLALRQNSTRRSIRIDLGPAASPAEPEVAPDASVILARPLVLSSRRAPDERLPQFGWFSMFVASMPMRMLNRSALKRLNNPPCSTFTPGPSMIPRPHVPNIPGVDGRANALTLYQRLIVRWSLGRLGSAMQLGRRWTLAGVRLVVYAVPWISAVCQSGVSCCPFGWTTMR